jgi:opacity protein-like surface antigen
VGVLSYPVYGLFSAYGKLGIARNRLTAGAAFPGGTFSGSENGTNLTYGAGLRYNFARNFAARAEWQRYHLDPDNFVGSGKIDYFSLGVLYGFY